MFAPWRNWPVTCPKYIQPVALLTGHDGKTLSINAPMSEATLMAHSAGTHNKLVGYIFWIFGFMGAHRFYYGRPVSGTIYFFTLGLLFIGWIVDLFLIPGMERTAERNYVDGPKDYTLSWILLTFLGVFGIHRMYLGKWLTGILWALTGGLFLLGYLYDLWTLNDQIDGVNRMQPRIGDALFNAGEARIGTKLPRI
jgi:TM2 domain-containing membrane protein YozV